MTPIVGSGVVGAGVGAGGIGAGVEMVVGIPAHPQVTAMSPLSGTEVTPSPSVSPSGHGSDTAVMKKESRRAIGFEE